MPVTDSSTSSGNIYQRDQYAKGGLGARYWDFRDEQAFSYLDERDAVILDAGCGEGITLEKLVRRFPSADVRGIDSLDENIAICKAHGLPADKGDLYHPELPDASVDAVLFMEVVEHLEEPEAALSEFHRVLKPGGKLIVVFPNDRTFKLARVLTFRFREAAYDPGHVRQWTIEDLEGLLVGMGFTVYAARSIPFRWWHISLHGIVAARKIGA